MLLFNSGLEADQIWALLLIGLASTLTMIYTIRAFMRIWWKSPAEGISTKPTGDLLYAPLLLVIMILVLGIFAEPLVALSRETVRWLANPEIYIQAVLGG